ncbi:MAG: hypothetical protein N3A69_06635 [Leptospiraceae bacterium]|nr:hypothetical protein [Leptospiraceae bacterium]
MFIIPRCFRCKNYIKFKTCKAFPNGIPDEVFFNEVYHTKPYPGDNGIQFEPKEKETEPKTD